MASGYSLARHTDRLPDSWSCPRPWSVAEHWDQFTPAATRDYVVRLLSVGRALTARGAMTHDVWIRVILPLAVELPPRMRVVNAVPSSAVHFSIIATDADSAAHPLRYGAAAMDAVTNWLAAVTAAYDDIDSSSSERFAAYYELDWPPSVAGGGRRL